MLLFRDSLSRRERERKRRCPNPCSLGLLGSEKTEQAEGARRLENRPECGGDSGDGLDRNLDWAECFVCDRSTEASPTGLKHKHTHRVSKQSKTNAEQTGSLSLHVRSLSLGETLRRRLAEKLNQTQAKKQKKKNKSDEISVSAAWGLANDPFSSRVRY